MTGEALKRKLSPMGKTAGEWAELIGVSDKTIYRMYKAQDVRTDMVERLCNALGKPVSFLYAAEDGDECDEGMEGRGAISAGLIRIRRAEEEEEPPRKACPAGRTFDLQKKVSGLLAAQHMKMSDLARHMEVTYSTVARMCARNSCTLASLVKMADFFKVPVAYFMPADPRAMEETEKDRQIHFLKGQIEVYRKTIASLVSGVGGAVRTAETP